MQTGINPCVQVGKYSVLVDLTVTVLGSYAITDNLRDAIHEKKPRRVRGVVADEGELGLTGAVGADAEGELDRLIAACVWTIGSWETPDALFVS
jgi:hypothetical protein